MDPVDSGSSSSESCAFETTPIASEEAMGCSQIANPFFAMWDYFCPVNPVLGMREFRYLPVFVEKWMGTLMYPIMTTFLGGEIKQHRGQLKIDEILKKLRAHAKRDLDYEVMIIKNNTINAWCLPGGKIAVHNRILERIDSFLSHKGEGSLTGYTHPKTGAFISYTDVKKDDVLAALIGHEMTHADARHAARKLELSFILQALIFGLQKWTKGWIDQKNSSLQKKIYRLSPSQTKTEQDRIKLYHTIHEFSFSQLTKIGIELYFLMGSRRHEYEADKYGTRLAFEAGYNPKGALFLQEILKEDGLTLFDYLPSSLQKVYCLFLSHPTCEERKLALFQDVRNWTAQTD